VRENNRFPSVFSNFKARVIATARNSSVLEFMSEFMSKRLRDELEINR